MSKFLSSAIGIVALVLSSLATVFLGVGVVLTLLLDLSPLEAIFLVIGSALLVVAFVLAAICYRKLKQVTRIRESGQETMGTIVEVRQNLRVRVKQQHPWMLKYSYDVGGQRYQGKESMFDPPEMLAPGVKVRVRYDSSAIRNSVLMFPQAPN